MSAIHLYTDEHALDNACALLGVQALDAARPPPGASAAERARLLEALCSEECTASEQLRLMLQQPERFGVRRALASDVLATCYEALWGPHARGAKVRLHVLPASRAERVAQAVATGKARRAAPAYHPRHPSAFRTRFLDFLADQLWLQPSDVPRLRQEAARRASEHYELTRAELARGLATPTVVPQRALLAGVSGSS